MANKKLCLAIHSMQVGGMERVMSELANFFCSKINLEVHLLLYGKRPEVFYELPDSIIVHKPESEFNEKFRLTSSFKRLLFIRRTVVGIKPDAILNFGEYWNSFILLSLIGLSYPVFISDRCSPLKRFGVMHSILRDVLYPKAKGIIAQTDVAKEVYSSKIRNKNVCVIGNPIRSVVKTDDCSERENTIITVGRLIESKNHDKLIELFASLPVNNWKFIVIGDDAQKQRNKKRLLDLIKELKSEDRIILLGNQPNVTEFMLRSKIFVFASISEGFPNVIGEALSSGLPVVAFDCVAGPSEMIEDGKNGFLVPLLDYNSMKAKLLELMTDEDLRIKMSKNAIMSITKFRLERIGEEYYSFIMS